MKILVFNSGSSSQKACLYEIGATLPTDPPAPQWEGRIEWSVDTAAIVVKNSQGVVLKEELPVSSREQVIRHLLRTLCDGKARAIASASEIDAVGHRVVHGGPHFEDPVVITPEVRSAIDSVSAFAPLHILAELEGMMLVEKLRGDVPQMAVFDMSSPVFEWLRELTESSGRMSPGVKANPVKAESGSVLQERCSHI